MIYFHAMTRCVQVELVDSLPCVPSSSSRFLADWRQLKTQVNRSNQDCSLSATQTPVIPDQAVQG